MNFLQRFWYTSYEVIKKRSMYKDMPFAGIAMLWDFLIVLVFLTIHFYWKDLSIAFSIPSPPLYYSKIQMVLIISVPYVIIYFFNRQKGIHIIKQFEDESETSKRKRHREFLIIVVAVFTLMMGGVIWRICLG